ncbi:DNA-binding protein SMUBP-2 [Amphibalanus amphitrite]|uniref:DNA-binding protein SMUBP-2 n=1 Tax=Amphibalanus amphitrite TaxID=1232801 RepID=A0A6A4W2Q3_AMPAM|nr:DNA-binding protein SMUBP-2 [Amphibalanus amphitrite]
MKDQLRGQGLGNGVDTVSLQPRFINQNLDASQRQAVGLALRDRPLAVIHGPPGTGKTTTIVEVILQHVERGQRVLVCTPSNKAVDNLLEGVWKQTRKAHWSLRMAEVTRLGHLARMEVKHRRFSHTVKLKRRLKRKSGKETREQVQERKAALADLLRETSVLMSTLASVRSVDLEHYFDLLVIDECGQATEPACWLAIPLAKRVLLAGDPHQLPPTILSQEAASGGLAVSLMERQMGLHGEGVVHMLDTQYRMHALIQEWSSKTLYGSKLKASKKVASRQLTDLPGVSSTSRTQQTLLLVDSAGCGLREAQDVNTSSHSNTGEAELVVCHARSLISAGLQAEDIGVITPYKQQVKLISARLRTAGLNVEVNSVDGYQGREKEAILLSLVRSNARGQCPRRAWFCLGHSWFGTQRVGYAWFHICDTWF